MAIRTEPYVKVKEIIKVAPTAIDADNNSDIGLVMVSGYGPKLGRVKGPSEFLSTYTADGITVPRDADITFINAYYMSYFAALVISRSTDTTATKGLMYYSNYFTSDGQSTGTAINTNCTSERVWYKDGTWLNYSGSWTLTIEKNSDGVIAFVVNDTVYYANTTKSDLVLMYPDYSDYNSFVSLGNVLWSSDTTNTKEVLIESLNDFCDSIRCNLNLLDNVNVESLSPVYKDENNDEINLSESTDPISIQKIIITVGFNCTINSLNIEAQSNNYSGCTYPAFSPTESVITTYDVFSLEPTWAASPTSSQNFYITVGDDIYYFYIGELPTSGLPEYKAAFPITNNNPDGQVASRLESVGISVISHSKDGNTKLIIKIVAPHETEVKLNDGSALTGVTAAKSTPRFSVRANTNAATNYLNVRLDNSIGSKFELIYGDEVYQVSLDPNMTDSNESNIYIDYLNTLGLPFTVDVINQEWNPTGTDGDETYSLGEPDESNFTSFGEGLHPDIAKKIPYLLKAADELGDQDQYPLAYMACAGCTKLSFVKRMMYIAQNNDWFLPVDVPYDYTTLGMIKYYFNLLDVDTSYCEAMGPFDRNQSLTGWINYIAASSLYYERLMANKANDNEFAPIYKETYGIMNYTNPVKLLTKPQREELLSLARPVNYVNYNSRTRNYYLNDDWTYQAENNVMSEEQNRRLVNKINRDVRHNMDQFIGKQNNAITRSQVVDMINYYMTNEIMTKSFAPEAYQVICNNKNNPDEIIRANKLAVTLRVRLYASIKYVTVINEVYPIGVEFEG